MKSSIKNKWQWRFVWLCFNRFDMLRNTSFGWCKVANKMTRRTKWLFSLLCLKVVGCLDTVSLKRSMLLEVKRLVVVPAELYRVKFIIPNGSRLSDDGALNIIQKLVSCSYARGLSQLVYLVCVTRWTQEARSARLCLSRSMQWRTEKRDPCQSLDSSDSPNQPPSANISKSSTLVA